MPDRPAASEPIGIHIFGASGTGVTTLGVALADRFGLLHLDTDRFYWKETEPPFTATIPPPDRVRAIREAMEGVDRWVLSGSLCGWGDPLIERFSAAVFLHVPSEVRMRRLIQRERQRYGSRIEPGGDLREHHLEFIGWAASYDTARAPMRSFDLHEAWIRRLPCPVIRLDSRRPVGSLVAEVLDRLSLPG